MTRKTSLVLAACALAATGAALPAEAAASQLIDRNAKNVRLAVSREGRALLTYRTRGVTRHVLAWGAINALDSRSARRQVQFKLDYSGGWGAYRRIVWPTFKNACRPYDGPRLPWLVAACKAPDGTYWAAQSWQPLLPLYGTKPWRPSQSAWWLLLSHWRGPIAKLEAWTNWINWGGWYHELFGRLTYRGKPVYGFKSDRYGAPLDRYGRVLYLDTYHSRYGRGWKRENGFLSHTGSGIFCYGFYPHDELPGYSRGGRRPRGNGKRYRLTVQGPGVTPDVMWQGNGLSDYNPWNAAHVAYETKMNQVKDRLMGWSRLCSRH